MKLPLAAAGLVLACTLVQAEPPLELGQLEGKYDQSKFTYDEALRQKYIMDLARLRFKEITTQPGWTWWEAVDAEIIRHPVPSGSDTAKLSKLRLGKWHSSRHDYLFTGDGKWKMTDDAETTTHGTWSIKGAQYVETFAGEDGASATTFTIILTDDENFIFTDGTHLFFEKRTLGEGLPIRRDERGE